MNPLNRLSITTLALTIILVPELGHTQAADNTGMAIDLIKEEATQNPSLFSFDYGIPNSPGLTLAGLADSKITPQTSLKPFVLALPGLLNGSSEATSAALDAAPAWMLGQQRSISAEAYKTNLSWGERIWFRTRLGLALYKGDDGGGDATKQKGSRLAFGLSTSLLDTSDPLAAESSDTSKGNRAAWLVCRDSHFSELDNFKAFLTTDAIRATNAGTNLALIIDDIKRGSIDTGRLVAVENELRAVHVPIPEDRASPSRDIAERAALDKADLDTYAQNIKKQAADPDATAAKILDECRKEASAVAQHGASIDVGGGAVWRGDAGEWKNFRDPNAAFWVATRYPIPFGGSSEKQCGENSTGGIGILLASCWMIGGSGRYSHGEFVATGDSKTPQFEAEVSEGWVGLERVDAKSKFGGYYGYLDQRALHSADSSFSKSGTRWLASAAYSLDFIQEGLWLQASYGLASGSVATLKDKMFIVSLSFGPPKIGSGFVPK